MRYDIGWRSARLIASESRDLARQTLPATQHLQSENARFRGAISYHAKLMIVHVARAGEVIGQFDEPTFQEKIFSGEIRPEDHYWVEGLADWKAVSQYRVTAKTVRMSVVPPEQPATHTHAAAPGDKLCSNCGYIGAPRSASAWLGFSRSATCPNCGAPDMIPLDSLVAQRFLGQQ